MDAGVGGTRGDWFGGTSRYSTVTPLNAQHFVTSEVNHTVSIPLSSSPSAPHVSKSTSQYSSIRNSSPPLLQFDRVTPKPEVRLQQQPLRVAVSLIDSSDKDISLPVSTDGSGHSGGNCNSPAGGNQRRLTELMPALASALRTLVFRTGKGGGNDPLLDPQQEKQNFARHPHYGGINADTQLQVSVIQGTNAL